MSNKFVKKADVYHQMDIHNQLVEYKPEESVKIRFSDEQVQFVTFTPLELPGGNNFTISFKMTCGMLSGTGSEKISSE